MKVSDLIVRCLEGEGVKYVFGIPGEENEDLLLSLETSDIRFITTRLELGASFMADVYGRLTGRAGVCLSTLGPGATNLVTGVADAHLDKAPVVAITGQAASDRMHKESHQKIDIINMFKPITKWNASIQNPQVVTEVVRKAFKLAEMEKPGATHFELPEDIARLDCSHQPITPRPVRRAAPDSQAVSAAMQLLSQSKRPLILAGNGAIRERSSRQLRALVAAAYIPVVSTFMGKGAVSDRDEHSLFAVGLQTRDYVNGAIDRADLILTVGYDIAEYAPEFWNHDSSRQIVHIDFLPAEVYDFYQPTVEIVSDVSGALSALTERVKKEHLVFDTGWFWPLRKQIEIDIRSYRLSPGDEFTVPGVLHIIRDVMNPGDILISDVGSHKMWIGRNYPTYEPNSVIMSNGLASMGIALPGGVAAKLACPDKQVVAVMGDGGFLMNSQEIETARRIGVGFTIIVFNDNEYGLISWKQFNHTGRTFGTKLTNPDLMQYARSFGIKGYAPQNLEQLQSNLKEAITSQELCLIEVPIQSKVNYDLSRKLERNLCEPFRFPSPGG
ncbi:MAG: acetolactate synthase large subunit [bacterium]